MAASFLLLFLCDCKMSKLGFIGESAWLPRSLHTDLGLGPQKSFPLCSPLSNLLACQCLF